MRPAESPGASLFQSAEALCGVRFVPQKKTASGGLSRYGYQEHSDKTVRECTNKFHPYRADWFVIKILVVF